MSDLLIPLYRLPDFRPPEGFHFRRPLACEGKAVMHFIKSRFSAGWADEIQPALFRVPASMFIAVHSDSQKLAGFCAWDCTALGFLGPVGTANEYRGLSVGGTLVLSALREMRHQGYGYAVVGDAGVPDFFSKTAGAVEIPDSRPGIYSEKLL
ncbi:GNAT family N-acetyltransferase [Candidatus Fermentibacteria bacterium]|nr:MAG: GNAT family N-acetyltransferase [Candidatus Fermentibacteria bacterium]